MNLTYKFDFVIKNKRSTVPVGVYITIAVDCFDVLATSNFSSLGILSNRTEGLQPGIYTRFMNNLLQKTS